jgi:hypothetical protein
MSRLVTLVVCGLLLTAGLLRAEEKKPAPTQFQFDVRVLEGDRQGSVAAGTVKVLAEPTLVTLENTTCTLVVGGEIPVPGGDELRFLQFGQCLKIRPTRLKTGKIQIDLEATLSEPSERKDEEVEILSRSVRAIRTVAEGKREVFRFPAKPGAKEAWLELTVSVPEPLDPKAVPPLPGFDIPPDPRFFPEEAKK